MNDECFECELDFLLSNQDYSMARLRFEELLSRYDLTVAREENESVKRKDQQELEQLATEIQEKLRIKDEEVNNEINKYQEERSKLENEISELETKIRETDSDTSRLLSEIESTKSEREKLEAELQEMIQNEEHRLKLLSLKDLQSEIGLKERVNEIARAENKRKKGDSVVCRRDNEKLKKEICATKARLAEATSVMEWLNRHTIIANSEFKDDPSLLQRFSCNTTSINETMSIDEDVNKKILFYAK